MALMTADSVCAVAEPARQSPVGKMVHHPEPKGKSKDH